MSLQNKITTILSLISVELVLINKALLIKTMFQVQLGKEIIMVVIAVIDHSGAVLLGVTDSIFSHIMMKICESNNIFRNTSK